MGFPITDRVPDPDGIADPASATRSAPRWRAHGARPGEPILGRPIDVVFVGYVHELPDQRPA